MSSFQSNIQNTARSEDAILYFSRHLKLKIHNPSHFGWVCMAKLFTHRVTTFNRIRNITYQKNRIRNIDNNIK